MPRDPNKIDYSRGFSEGFEAFGSLRDPRNGGNTRHHFGEILFIASAGVLCGVRSYEMMEEFAELHEPWLRKWIKPPNGIPCDNTFSRVFQAIEPAAFTHCITAHLEALGMEDAANPQPPAAGGTVTPIHDSGRWKCSDKQKDLILKLVDEHHLDKNEVPRQRFGKGVKQLSKLEASGLIDELLDTHGGSRPGGRNGNNPTSGRNGSAYRGGANGRRDAA